MTDASDNIAELAAALAKAQGHITGALKDTNNTFFKSKYADLAACWDACRKALSDNGLAVIQTTTERDGHLYVATTLAHSSGQWVRGWMPVKTKDDGPQAMGSGVTYARRYALAAIVGLAQVDDDAEAAQGRTSVSPTRIDPLDNGQTGTPQQHKYAAEFAKAFRDALDADIGEDEKAQRIAQLGQEIKEDETVMGLTWSLLKKDKLHKAITLYMGKARKEAA
jgi:hypothetical protein